MEFNERLKQYREELGIKSKKEMAKKLDVDDSVYGEVELGARGRGPSKDFLRKLVAYSKKPEEYWLYGAIKIEELDKLREEYKSTRNIVDELIEGEYIKDINSINSNIEKILLTALKADIQHILLKRKVVD